MNLAEEDPHVNMVMKKRQYGPRNYIERQNKCSRCGYEHSERDKCPPIGQL